MHSMLGESLYISQTRVSPHIHFLLLQSSITQLFLITFHNQL